MLCLMDIDINYYGDSMAELEERYHFLDAEVVDYYYNVLCDEPGMFLPYYYGLVRIEAYEETAQQLLGDRFNPVTFNDALLSAGNVNFTIIDDVMAEYLLVAQGSASLPFLTDEKPQVALRKEVFLGA